LNQDLAASAGTFADRGLSEETGSFELNEPTSPTETPVRRLQWLQPMLKIASVFFIGLGIYYFMMFDQMTEVQTLVAEKTTIELPDASKVTLNALSEVRYNKGAWSEKREIELDGEAFFDVAKGATFDVVTDAGTISVLGTEFNVKNRGAFFEVACYEGPVRVVTADHTEILKVGDNFKLYKGDAVKGRHSQDTPLWTDNMSDFQRIPLSQVLAELERQYGVDTLIENIDTDQLFTGAFVHNNLENALKSISEPLNLDYEIINPDQVRLSKRE
ncbi:MAG: FecR domain-containing protein, partial [Pricia sp.]